MTDYIKNILQIKDPNLHFTDVVSENNDGWETQAFIGTVSLKLDRCPHCGFAGAFIKNGHSYQTILRVPSLRMVILTKPLSTSQLTKVVPLCCGSVNNA